MLVFIDESGDSGMRGKPGSSPHFVVTGVLFEDHDEASQCESRIQELRESRRLSPRFEFHFNSCSHDLRTAFLQAVRSSGFFYHSIVLNKAKLWSEGFHDKSSFYKYTTGLVFENMKPQLNDSIVVLDKCGNQEFRCELAKYLKRRVNETGGKRLIKKVKMQRSDGNDLLQLADMVCGAVARSYSSKENRWVFRKLIRHRELRVQIWPK
ncbi:MAG: DUF3800 domain-containing protein [Bryobacterales bacterium]